MPMVFPTAFLSLLAYFLLRVFIGTSALYLGTRHLTRDRRGIISTLGTHAPRRTWLCVVGLGLSEIAIGALYIVGAWTQIAALGGMALALFILLFRKHLAHPAIPQPLFWVLFFGISLSLFITGAGAFAFDLPI